MLTKINLIDYHKFNLIDSKNSVYDRKTKALLVDIEVSVGGKVINNRIYPPEGQKKNIDSWLNPYGKPVLMHHDDSKDAIGRFKKAEWVSIEDQAMAYLRGNTKLLDRFKDALGKRKHEQIVNLLVDMKALDNSSGWPGLSKVLGQIRITDEEAIQKFIDERYLTLSAGQSTDQFTCLTCGAEWQLGDICEHKLGMTNEDGLPSLFLCGNMKGQEVSTVNSPANATSIAVAMEFEDGNEKLVKNINLDSYENPFSYTINFKDSFEEKSMSFKLEDLAGIDSLSFAKNITDEQVAQIVDALKGDSHYEIEWLIRIHDALHGEYDWRLKYERDAVKTAVFKLHASLHGLADEKGFRDSVLNGQLDEYSGTGEETGEYMLPGTVSKDSELENEGEVADAKEEIQKDEVEDKKELLIDSKESDVIDWFLLDLALQALVAEDVRLTTEQRNELAADSFCGPDSCFPIHSHAYVEAAKDLLSKVKLSDSQKTEVLALIDSKAKVLGIACKCNQLDSVLQTNTTLLKDLETSLSKIEGLESRLLDFGRALITAKEPNKNITDIKLDELDVWFDNIKVEPTDSKSSVLKHPIKDIKPLNEEKQKLSTDSLSAYCKKVITTYQKKVSDGTVEDAAWYLNSCSDYLPKNFKIEDYV